jgi:hypothetical protein
MYILGKRFSGKKSLSYYFANDKLFNNYNRCFDGTQINSTCVNIDNMIKCYKILTSYKQKIILLTINSTNYITEIQLLQDIFYICDVYKIPIIFVITKVDLILWDYVKVKQIENYLLSTLYHYNLLYKIIPISINQYYKRAYNISNNDNSINLYEAIDYIKFYTYIHKDIYNIYQLFIKKDIRILEYNFCRAFIDGNVINIKVIEHENMYECLLDNCIKIDIYKPLMLINNKNKYMFVSILEVKKYD